MDVFRFLVALSFLWTFSRTEEVLPCVFMESCILPCSFTLGDEILIHWIVDGTNRPVHSYYHSQDQLAYQDGQFKGRTSLFHEQIPKGNASLLLSNVQVQDQARYKCYISTALGTKESYVNLKVDAPVSKIHIEQVGNRISCSSDGIYPKPKLTWSSNPPSRTSLSSSNATVQQTEQLLYSISSSLTRPDAPDVDYTCTISTSTNSKTATLFRQASLIGSNTQMIPCAASTTPLTSVVWRFNHSQVIVDNNRQVSEEWRPHVQEVEESGSLILQLSSSDLDGIYTCELNNPEATLIKSTFVKYEDSKANVPALVAGIIVVVVIGIGIGIVVICFVKGKCACKGNKRNKTNRQSAETQSLKSGNGTAGVTEAKDSKQTATFAPEQSPEGLHDNVLHYFKEDELFLT